MNKEKSSLIDQIASFFSPKEKKSEGNVASTVKDLKEYKSRLYGSLSRDLSEFEKNFLLISSATLAFSITFIKDIVRIDAAVYINILFISWVLIAGSVGIMMFTFIKSAYASDKLWFLIDDFQAERNLYVDTEKIDEGEFVNIKKQTSVVFKKSKKDLKNMRYAAIFFFLVGLTLFGFFTGINTYKENAKSTARRNNMVIELNPKTRQINVNGVKLLLSDTTIIIEK